MFEIKSCGTTIDFCTDHFQASNVYDGCKGPHVQMLKFNAAGQKFVVAEKFSNHKVVSSKAQAI